MTGIWTSLLEHLAWRQGATGLAAPTCLLCIHFSLSYEVLTYGHDAPPSRQRSLHAEQPLNSGLCWCPWPSHRAISSFSPS